MASASAKGDLALTIDELGLEASLRFTPDPNGAEWTGDKLLRLVMDARVGGVNPKRAEDILGKFGRSRGPVVEILAKGLAPEEPVPETPEWEDLAPGPELESLVAETVAAAGVPELYRIRVETIKTETTVKKPGALPFLPPKIEKVVGQEKREVREPLYPDTTVVKTGFVRRGGRICLLSSSKQGKQGKSIFGKPIPPQGKDTAFNLGQGTERAKSEVLATWDGVVRGGEHWVEVIPLALPSWSVDRSSDGATWYLNFNPGDSRLPLPDPADILKAALDQGADPDTLVEAPAVLEALAEATSTKDALYSYSLSQDRNGKAEVTFSPDGLQAWLNLWKGRGRGRPLELSAVTLALKAAGIKLAKPEQIKKDILEFHKGDKAELLDYLLAEGKAPTRGKDREVSLNAAFLPEERAQAIRATLAAHPSLAVEVRGLDEFPVETATKLAMVQAGQRFGELSAQGVGQPGTDLKGQTLPGIPGNDPHIKTWENVEFAKGCLTAAVPGLLLCRGKEDSWHFRVLPFRDSSIEVSVAPDAMTAYLNLHAEQGFGRALTVEGVLEVLAQKGVVFGLDSRAISEGVASARSGQVVLHKAVAFGKPGQAAGAPRRVWLIGPAAPSEGPRPSGLGPYYLKAGTPIVKVEKVGGESQSGTDVLGKTLPAPMATPEAFGEGEGPGSAAFDHDATVAEVTDEKGAVVYTAASTGELRVEAARILILERFVVKGDVGPDIGNVRFAGPVHVHGSVRRGFQLFAGGDAAIAGAVEAALVSSDGAVLVGGGIKGERRGTIRAKRSVEVAFAEQALILAVEDVRIKGGAALCSIKTNGRLQVGLERGSLVGGIARVRKGVEAGSLGSENGIKTEVSFGQDYLIADMIEAEEKEIEKLKLLIVKTDRSMAAAAGPALDQARLDKVKLVKLLEKRSIRLFDLREKFEEHFAGAEVKVRGTVYPGVILESHNRFYEVRSRRTGVAFLFDPQQGRIIERPL